MRPCSPCSTPHVVSAAAEFNKAMSDTKLLFNPRIFNTQEEGNHAHGNNTGNSCKTQWSCRRVSNLNVRSWQVKQHDLSFCFERRRRLSFPSTRFFAFACLSALTTTTLAFFRIITSYFGYREKKIDKQMKQTQKEKETGFSREKHQKNTIPSLTIIVELCQYSFF